MTDSWRRAAIPPELEAEIDACCDRFENAWQAGETPRLEASLEDGGSALRPYLLRELLALEQHYRRDADGSPLDADGLGALHPTLAAEIAAAWKGLVADQAPSADLGETGEATERAPHVNQAATEQAATRPRDSSDVSLPRTPESRGLHVRCPHCSNPVQLLADTPFEDVTCITCGSTFNLVEREGPTPGVSTLGQIGRFELVARLGVGGFGTVWKARDKQLDRLVAIKLPRKGELSPQEIGHFFREARAAAQLRHPNIVSIYEVGREDDAVYIVSDYVRGVSLSDWLTSGRPTSRETAALCAPIARALHHAHQQGVVHRDVKPSNIMLDEDEVPHVMDFGLAKREAGEITMTLDGQIVGTPGYMSPEQARGKGHWTDRRTDVYSLGAVMFRMLTGELPFRGNAQMQLHCKMTSDAPDPRRLNSAIARDVATICLKCLEREPNRRYGTALEVAEELDRFLRGEPIRARPLSGAARLWRWALRKPAVAAAASLALLLAVAGPLVAWQFRNLYRTERELRESVETRLGERDRLISRHADERARLSEANRALRGEVASLRGQQPGIAESLPRWRISLIEQFVNLRYDAVADALRREDLAPRATARAALGLGILCQQLGRTEDAVAMLSRAEKQLDALAAESTVRQDVRAALADCLMRLSELHRAQQDESLADQRIEEALAVRRQERDRSQHDAKSDVRLLETLMQKVDRESNAEGQLGVLEDVRQLTSQIADHWPTDLEEIYDLACFLTLSDSLLPREP